MGLPRIGARFERSYLVWAAAFVVLTGLASLSATRPTIAAVVIGGFVYFIILSKAGIWRTMVGTSMLVSFLRSGATAAALSGAAWYVLQFVPILIAGLASLREEPHGIRNADRKVILFMVLFAVDALATNITTLAPAATFPQTILLVAMTGFLLFTYTRRWTSKDMVRGDVSMVFVLITTVQLVSVGAVAAGESWAFDPDYGRFRGLFSNANYAGMMSAIGIAIGFYLLRGSRRRVPVLASMVALAAAMLMSGSRGALLALGIAALVLILTRTGRKVILPLGGLASVGAMIALLINPHAFDPLKKFFFRDGGSNDITSGRLNIYQWMLRMFQRSPWTGTGYRSVEALSPWGMPGHDIYLTVLTEMGLLGAFLFACLMIAVLVASRNRKASRPLLVVAVTVAAAELTESAMYGWGGPTALTEWLIVLAFAASGRFLSGGAPTHEAASLPRR